jgi:hypothetical protein
LYYYFLSKKYCFIDRKCKKKKPGDGYISTHECSAKETIWTTVSHNKIEIEEGRRIICTYLSGALKGLCKPCLGQLVKLSTKGW